MPHRCRRAFFFSVIAAAAACSTSPVETTEATTAPLALSRAWVDGNVQSFQSVPSVPGLVYVLGTDGNLWREVGSMSNRTWVDGNVRAYQPIDGNVVYVLGSDLKLWREVGSMSNRTLVQSGVSGFQVTADGLETVYYVDSTASLWIKSKNVVPELMATQVRGYQWVPYWAIAEPAIYVLFNDRSLWRGDPRFVKKEQIDQSVSSFRAVDAMSFFDEHDDARLYAVHDKSPNAALVDKNVEFFRPFNDMTSFVEDTSFQLWREQFGSRNRDLVAQKVKAYEPVDVDTVYVLGFDGNLWREKLTAPACNYELPAPYACTHIGQNFHFVAAWAVTTGSGACPNIQAATGYWSTQLADGGVPGDDQVGATPPTCAQAGQPDSCCLYVWYPATKGALQDPSVLCTPGATRISAIGGCGSECPSGLSCGSPGGGGCASCAPSW